MFGGKTGCEGALVLVFVIFLRSFRRFLPRNKLLLFVILLMVVLGSSAGDTLLFNMKGEQLMPNSSLKIAPFGRRTAQGMSWHA